MIRYINTDSNAPYSLRSVQGQLPEGHLARIVAGIVEQLDFTEFTRQYEDCGWAPHHPGILFRMLIYGYATGVYSSRKIERASYDSIAFRYLASNTHPDHGMLASFRRRFLPQVEKLFVQALEIAQEIKLTKVGQIELDGIKIKEELKEEVKALIARAEAADWGSVLDGMDWTAESAHYKADKIADISQNHSQVVLSTPWNDGQRNFALNSV